MEQTYGSSVLIRCNDKELGKNCVLNLFDPLMKKVLQYYNCSTFKVKGVDSHLCRWSSIPSKSCSFLKVSLSKSLSLCFMCSDRHAKYRMPCGFTLTSSLLLDFHVKQYTHAHARTHAHTLQLYYNCFESLTFNNVCSNSSWL